METPRRRLTHALQENDRLKADFISTELTLAITFCRIALSSNDPDAADRSARNARRAREVACHALETSSLESSTQESIDEDLRRLADLLKKFDESKSAAKPA